MRKEAADALLMKELSPHLAAVFLLPALRIERLNVIGKRSKYRTAGIDTQTFNLMNAFNRKEIQSIKTLAHAPQTHRRNNRLA